MLNASARNSTRRASENTKFLNNERSTCRVPGPYRTLRPELPKTYWPGATKAEASNQRSMVRSPAGSSPDAMRFGNCEPVPVFRLFVCIVGVKGSPVWKVPMVFTCHPPASHSMGPRALESQCRPLPNGSSSVLLSASLWRTSKVELPRCAKRLRESWIGLLLDSPLVSSMLWAQVHAPEKRAAPIRRWKVVCNEL